jgi:hypothetical protein
MEVKPERTAMPTPGKPAQGTNNAGRPQPPPGETPKDKGAQSKG